VHVLILSVDTSSSSGSIAVLNDAQLLAVISTTTEETYSSRIFRQLEFLLRELSLELDRFDLFAVNAGPGSFTGLRVGLTTAKAWAESFSRPIVAVRGLEAVAIQVASDDTAIVPVIDARRSQIYAGAYRRAADADPSADALARLSQDFVMTPQEFWDWLNGSPELSGAVLATTTTGWLSSLLATENHSGDSRFAIRQVSPVLAPWIGKIAHQSALRGETVDALRLDANYVRRCDAERNWKGK
jgi:tRNA threonylcarbamoyladenosine biosynthesis protein TsaB